MKFLPLFVVFTILLSIGCGKSPEGDCPSTSDTPTEAYKRLYTAVKSRNADEIKAEMSSRTLSFAEGAASQQKKSVEKLFENGLTATTFSPDLPQIRDERVDCKMGAVEVYNSRDSKWEDLPFVLENGRWKLAVGDMFAGTYKSPGKGRAQKEAEAANAMGNKTNVIHPNVNIPGITTNSAPTNAK